MDPASPVLVDTLKIGGVVRHVLVRRQLLVAMTQGPSRVRTFLLGNGASPWEVGSVSLSGQVQAAYLNADRLHLVQGSPGDWDACLSGLGCEGNLSVEVYEVGWDLPELLRLGEYPAAEALVPAGKTSGEILAVPVADGLRVFRAEALP